MNYLDIYPLVREDVLKEVFIQKQQHVPQSCVTGYNLKAHCALLKGQVPHVAQN